LAVLIVWGPLMIGGGYYVITGNWDWGVVIASLPYALGVTTVIFGKHIDKYKDDNAKGIHTLPVLIGEKAGRYAVIGMIFFQYISVVYLIVIGFFTPILLVVLLAIPALIRIWPIYSHSKPEQEPPGYIPNTWPLYYVAAAFYHNRSFGLWFLLGLIVDAVLKVYILK
jgi:1,4-dihydroxy-2-naphthoate octaprenyltransferase